LVFGLLDPTFAALFFAVAFGYGILLSFAALLVEELSYHATTSGATWGWRSSRRSSRTSATASCTRGGGCEASGKRSVEASWTGA